MEQKYVVKHFSDASDKEIFECAKQLIENHQFVFEIYNDDEVALLVNAFENVSEGYLTDGDHCIWEDFNDENPNLWDEFDMLYPECADDDSDEEED